MAGLWLHFGDNYAKATTKQVQFQDLVVGEAEEVDVLEGLRVLSMRREQSAGRGCFSQPGAGLEEQAQWTLKYLGLLRQFVLGSSRWEAQLAEDRCGFIWSSPLSTLATDARLALRCVHAEEIMVLHLYAAILMQQAYELATLTLTDSSGAVGEGQSGGGGNLELRLGGLVLSISGLPSPNKEVGQAGAGAGAAPGSPSPYPLPQPGNEHATVAGLYRRAAGVFQFVAGELFPAACSAPGWPTGSRPVELWEGAAEAMQGLCLAQAQGVAAHRAESKGTSPALVAALHRGTADLYEQASATLRGIKPPAASGLAAAAAAATSASPVLSERLKRFLAISATLHEAKGLRALAAACRADLELGQAVACLRDAISKVQQCLVVCEKDTDWKAALRPELGQLEGVQQVYEREREEVYLQRVPAAAPPLPTGKCIVSPAPYETPECGDTSFAL